MMAATIEAARIAGAIKALRALHHLNQVTEEEGYHSAYLDFYMQRLARVRAMTDALGPMTPELEGALSVLVEYVCEGLDGGPPDLEFGDWTPLAAMTADRQEATASKMFVAYFYCSGWDLSLGVSLCLTAPNLEIHVPFGFFRFGWVQSVPGPCLGERLGYRFLYRAFGFNRHC